VQVQQHCNSVIASHNGWCIALSCFQWETNRPGLELRELQSHFCYDCQMLASSVNPSLLSSPVLAMMSYTLGFGLSIVLEDQLLDIPKAHCIGGELIECDRKRVWTAGARYVESESFQVHPLAEAISKSSTEEYSFHVVIDLCAALEAIEEFNLIIDSVEKVRKCRILFTETG